MKLISWNVNGLRACLGKGFGDYFASQNADFFCLQETKMQPGQAEIPAEGYHQYFYSAEKKGYSGTAILTRHEPLSISYGMGSELHDHEGRLITLEYENFYIQYFASRDDLTSDKDPLVIKSIKVNDSAVAVVNSSKAGPFKINAGDNVIQPA